MILATWPLSRMRKLQCLCLPNKSLVNLKTPFMAQSVGADLPVIWKRLLINIPGTSSEN